MDRKNVHLTLSRDEADDLVAGRPSAAVMAKTESAIGEAEKLEQAIESVRKLDAEGKLNLTPADPSQVPERERGDYLRVIFREPDGEERRCSTFLPLTDPPPGLRAALAAAYPAFTAYTYQEAERMVRDER